MAGPAGNDGPGKGQISADDREALSRRAADLGSQIDSIQAKKKAEQEAIEDKAIRGRGMAYGLRMSSELVAAIIVGGLIGYGLDQFLNTTPWLFLVFFVLGFAAGILNVTRAFQRMQAEIKKETGGDIGHAVKDDDD